MTPVDIPARLPSSRLLCVAVAAALLAGAAGAIPATAAPGKTCAELVLEDWYDNYRVDRQIHDAQCYRDAVKLLQVDIVDYGSADEDILRALSYARRGKLDPGDGAGGNILTASGGQPASAGAPAAAPETVASGVGGPSPSSVPLPLIGLGTVSLLLFAAGGAGYLRRRFARGSGPPGSG